MTGSWTVYACIFLGTALDDLANYVALDKDSDRIIVRVFV